MPLYTLPVRMLEETFATFRSCGKNEHECQLYWASKWDDVANLCGVVHPRHTSSRYGLSIDSAWISAFWKDLADHGMGVRIQVHTHPCEAFHSPVDDGYPLLVDPGFLSLVIPNFAMGPTGFEGAYLTEIQPDGTWLQVPIDERIRIDG